MGMARKVIPSVPRWWKMLVRKRPSPLTPMAKSISFFSANSSRWRGLSVCSAQRFRSSGRSVASAVSTSSPCTRSMGGRPTLR
jgi:hypothetical protein